MKLMVVDDYPLEGQTIEHLLKHNRPEIIYLGQALSGNQALTMAKQTLPDIILLDIKMPGIDGLTLLKMLKDSYPWIKTIIVTAFDSFDYAQKAIRAGAGDYFLKPVRASLLLSSIDKLCHEIHSERIPIKSCFDSVSPDYKLLIGNIMQGEADDSELLLDQIWEDLKLHCGEDASILGPCAIEMAANLLYISADQSCCADALQLAHHSFINDMTSVRTVDSVYQNLKSFVSLAVGIFDHCAPDIGYEQISRAKKLIEINLDSQEEVSLESISHELYISPFYLSRLFKKKAGVNFMDYLIECRLKKAKLLLLTTSDTVENIAQKTGYNESNSFRRLFKKKTGVSPNAFRSMHADQRGKDGLAI